MRLTVGKDHDYRCEILPRDNVIGRWGRWKWQVLYKDEVVAWGIEKKLRKAEKKVEKLAAQHKAEQDQRRREADDEQVASVGKEWVPFL